MPEKDQQPVPLLLTPEQVADILQVEVATLRRWVTEGRVPFHRIGRKTRFSNADVEAIIKSAHVPATGSVDHGDRHYGPRRRSGRSA